MRSFTEIVYGFVFAILVHINSSLFELLTNNTIFLTIIINNTPISYKTAYCAAERLPRQDDVMPREALYMSSI